METDGERARERENGRQTARERERERETDGERKRGTDSEPPKQVALGHKVKGCPYFAARQLQLEASIVFCPYNYILDPAVREVPIRHPSKRRSLISSPLWTP